MQWLLPIMWHDNVFSVSDVDGLFVSSCHHKVTIGKDEEYGGAGGNNNSHDLMLVEKPRSEVSVQQPSAANIPTM